MAKKKKSKKTSEKKTSKSEDSKVVKRTYSFPTLGKSVEAASREEALEKISK